jgi:hypothetical protein
MEMCASSSKALERTGRTGELSLENLLAALVPLSLRMVYQEYDFTRNPVVEHEVFFLESKCIRCGFTVVARSLEDLLEEETRHRPQCPLARAA